MAYYHGHMQTLQKDYPPFNYDDEPEEAARKPSAGSSGGKRGDWSEPTHPGPLLVGKHRTPAGGFFSDGRPYYAKPDPPEMLREAAPSAHHEPDYPWLTAFQREAGLYNFNSELDL